MMEYNLKSSRLLKNAHLRRCPPPSSLRHTPMYASFHGISSPPLRAAQSPTLRVGSPVSEALHLDILPQPQRSRFFDSFAMIRLAPAIDINLELLFV